jgi:hypothetical protein
MGAARLDAGLSATGFPHWMLCKAFPGRVPQAERVLERHGWRFNADDTRWRNKGRGS